jgi:tellurite methyltransferase
MDIKLWEARYRLREREKEDFDATPAGLLVETVKHVPPGRALDLACGTGRNALWLAEHGWAVTAVDGSQAAIDVLQQRASGRGLSIETRVADLEAGQYSIEPSTWDLVAICYYLQRDLLEPAKSGLVPGGLVLTIVHIAEPGEEPTNTRLRPGELAGFFPGWGVLHSYEGKPRDSVHQRSVAEIAAWRPTH